MITNSQRPWWLRSFALACLCTIQVMPVPAQESTPAKETVKPDDTTPDGAIRVFFQAIADGDAKLAQSYLLDPTPMKEWTEVQSSMSLAFKRLATAAARFSDEGKSLQTPVPALLAIQKLETVKVEQEGDSAQWPSNPQVPMKLQRVEGHWKLDLFSSFQKPEHLEMMNRVQGRIAKYVDRIAADIESGKLDSVDSVRAEMRKERDALNRDEANR
jgi:hypothetical protein